MGRLEDEAKEAERIRKDEEKAAARAAAEAAEAAAEAAEAEKAAAPAAAPVQNGLAPKNQNLERLQSQDHGSRAGSRRGSADVVLGGSRRGSYYGDEITTRATVAMVVDDPESKEKINALLDDQEQDNAPREVLESIFLA